MANRLLPLLAVLSPLLIAWTLVAAAYRSEDASAHVTIEPLTTPSQDVSSARPTVIEPTVKSKTTNLPATGVYREEYQSLQALSSASEVIAVVSPIGVRKQVYPSLGGRQEIAWTLYDVRVETVLKGTIQAGSIVTFVIVGGDLANAPVPAAGEANRVPAPGANVTRQEFADYPPLVPGRKELVFMSSYVHPQFGETWWGSYAEGRYVLTATGALSGTAGSFNAGNGARRDVDGRTVEEIQALLATGAR